MLATKVNMLAPHDQPQPGVRFLLSLIPSLSRSLKIKNLKCIITKSDWAILIKDYRILKLNEHEMKI